LCIDWYIINIYYSGITLQFNITETGEEPALELTLCRVRSLGAVARPVLHLSERKGKVNPSHKTG